MRMMPYNPFKNEKETWCYINVILKTSVENNMDKTYEQQGSLKVNRDNWEETVGSAETNQEGLKNLTITGMLNTRNVVTYNIYKHSSHCSNICCK